MEALIFLVGYFVLFWDGEYGFSFFRSQSVRKMWGTPSDNLGEG